MTCAEISETTKLLRGTVTYRLRKLGHVTGKGIQYDDSIVNEVMNYERHLSLRRGINLNKEYDIYFFWISNTNNSSKVIAEHFNVPIPTVNYILDRIVKTGYVTVESKINRE